MQKDFKIIISDTSCLILLDKIEQIDLLKSLSKQVYITEEIKKEFGRELPDWIQIKSPSNKKYQKLIEIDLDKGEAGALALSLDIENSIVLIDDLKGRKYAEKLNINFSGTLGLLLKAKNCGIIKELKPVIERIKNTNFRFSDSLLKRLIIEAGEKI